MVFSIIAALSQLLTALFAFRMTTHPPAADAPKGKHFWVFAGLACVGMISSVISFWVNNNGAQESATDKIDFKRLFCGAAALALLPGLSSIVLAQGRNGDARTGESMYQQSCAPCHDKGVERAPQRAALKAMTPEQVLGAMESGEMIYMAARWPVAGRRAIAEYITEKKLGTALRESSLSPSAICSPAAPADFGDPLSGPRWNGWGQNTSNTRFQDAAMAGLTAADVPRLKLKWAFGYPGDILATSNGAPSVLGGRIFISSPGGTIYSLNASSGCIYWSLNTGSRVRTALSIGKIETGSGPVYAAYFGDARATAWAVDAATGKELWKTKVDDTQGAGITGSPVFYKGKLYVPVRGNDEVFAVQPSFECCKFRGSMVALDAATGKQIWKTWTIDEPAKQTTKNAQGVQLWGPSGAPIWTTPAIDPKLNAIYAATGDNYSKPATKTSDAFIAMDLDTGKILWTHQMTPNDAWTSACRLPDKTNCPDESAPDFDFAASPILVNLPNGKRAVVAGQKSGFVHALDPDNKGKLLWQVRAGKGGTFGGVQWGSAADAANVYVAISDLGRILLPFDEKLLAETGLTSATDADPKVGGGIVALRLTNGERMWFTPPPGCGDRKPCSPAQSAAVTAIPGIAFSGSVDGHMRAYAAKNGAILWDFDTIRSYQTVDGVEARGGSLNGPGPVIVGGLVIFNSGYSSPGGAPGNVLLAFSVDGK
jgi:polyvinyl alcohol dehydrogenase (cytochrome)